MTLQNQQLSPGERMAFETWLGAEGVDVKLLPDQRDGDYYQLTIR